MPEPEIEVRCTNCNLLKELDSFEKAIYKTDDGNFKCGLNIDNCRDLEVYRMLKKLHNEG